MTEALEEGRKTRGFGRFFFALSSRDRPACYAEGKASLCGGKNKIKGDEKA